MTQRESEWQEEIPLVLSERVSGSSRPNLRAYTHESRLYLIAKRTMDIVLSIAALIVLLPFLIVVSVMICLDDPSGGPIFVQDRVGKNGKLFKLVKFIFVISEQLLTRKTPIIVDVVVQCT